MPRGGKREGAGRKPKDRSGEQAIKRMPWRPSKYDPSFCDMVIDAMKQGYSLTAFAGMIGVGRSTLTGWASDYPDFGKAIRVAHAVRLVWWEGKAIRVAERGGGPGTAQIIQFSLKNIAPEEYSDKQKLEHTGEGGGALQQTLRVEFVKTKTIDLKPV